MTFAAILNQYQDRYRARYRESTTPDQWSAIHAILGCRSGQYGQILLACPQCQSASQAFQSCGHRSCNQCQNHAATRWLERQQAKLLPARYFMVTFTIPSTLRAVARANAETFYSAMFQCASDTLKEFGLNDRKLAGTLGMTAVLHTHTRRLDYHPHIHIVLPGGSLHKGRREWRKRQGNYLFKEQNLAAVFRAKMLNTLARKKLPLPPGVRTDWIVDCLCVGNGLSALQYLSRYLYRGVIRDHQIIADDGTEVTFRYQESKTGMYKTRTLPGEDFIALVIQHTLPKGFRRTRDYGFLHGNAKRLLEQVQLFLKVILPVLKPKEAPAFHCRTCQAPLSITGFVGPRARPG